MSSSKSTLARRGEAGSRTGGVCVESVCVEGLRANWKYKVTKATRSEDHASKYIKYTKCKL